MDGLRGIIHYQTEEYGGINVKLAEVLDSRGITRNRLRPSPRCAPFSLASFLLFLNRIDYKIEDLLEYQKPSNQE